VDFAIPGLDPKSSLTTTSGIPSRYQILVTGFRRCDVCTVCAPGSIANPLHEINNLNLDTRENGSDTYPYWTTEERYIKASTLTKLSATVESTAPL